ncbi:MAG: DUF308 domain-containing protein [Anaerolineae bacterium]|nr:DUF308 domain-containing protein [Anaerolineae bacterium]
MTAMSADEQKQVKQAIVDHWWLILLNGIALIIIGALLLGQPAKTTVVLVQILGIYWIIAGIFNLVGVFTGSAAGSRGWAIVLAILYIIAGIVIVGSPIAASLFTTTFLVYLLAFSAIFNGIIMIFAGRQTHTSAGRERSLGSFLLGAFNLIIGVIILMAGFNNPIVAVSSLIWAAGFMAVLFGIITTMQSFRVRSLKA